MMYSSSLCIRVQNAFGQYAFGNQLHGLGAGQLAPPMGEGPGAEGREAGWWGRCRREYRGDRIGTKPMGCPWARTRVLAFGCRMHPTKMHLEPDASWTRMHSMQYAIIPEYAIMLSNFAVKLL